MKSCPVIPSTKNKFALMESLVKCEPAMTFLRFFFVFQTLEEYSQGWILISFDYVIQR